MCIGKLQQTYVPTKKAPIPALQPTNLKPINILSSATTCAHILEPTVQLQVPVVELDGRWLQIPTERWELLLPTTHTAASSSEASGP